MRALENFLQNKYPRINEIVSSEHQISRDCFNLIGSANRAFQSVLDARSLPFHANPAEGHPGNRYFPATKNIDELEIYAEELASELFSTGSDYWISLQPLSGTQANQIVYNAILNKDEYVLVMKPSNGGHVSHWSYPKKNYNVVTFELGNDKRINYDQISELVHEKKPKLLVLGCSSYPFPIDYPRVGRILENLDTLLLADISHTAVYVSSGLYPSPFGAADFVTMTTHKTTRGPRGGIIFSKKNFEKKIKYSIFPMSQGAPIFPDMISKCVMLAELKQMDLKSYAEECIQNAKSFCKYISDRKDPLHIEFGGTGSHLVILNVKKSGLTGVEAERLLEESGILVNRNLIPNDPLNPAIASGIRLGTLMITTDGIQKSELAELANLFHNAVKHRANVKSDVLNLRQKILRRNAN